MREKIQYLNCALSIKRLVFWISELPLETLDGDFYAALAGEQTKDRKNDTGQANTKIDYIQNFSYYIVEYSEY